MEPEQTVKTRGPSKKKLKPTQPYVAWFSELGRSDVGRVGGKNASLGEMISNLAGAGIGVPDGFALTTDAYWRFIDHNDLRDTIAATVLALNKGKIALDEAGRSIRRKILRGTFPDVVADAIRHAYAELCARGEQEDLDVAVRSSATAEDLPQASFAGQQESFLNVRGANAVIEACRRCYASLFTDRAISYRAAHGFEHMKVALSVGIQQMIRSDQACAGVMFSIDTESGFPDIVLIESAWGLGESVVQGTVDPDSFMVFKPLLSSSTHVPVLKRELGGKDRKVVYGQGKRTAVRSVKTTAAERSSLTLNDDEILQLARWAVLIERHYDCPMDMEWAKDGRTGDLYIVQARPETVESRREAQALTSYSIKKKGRLLLTGHSIGAAIAVGKVCKLRSAAEIDKFKTGYVLVTPITDPDWVPIMRRAAAIITDHGGRTSHAAIVSRELGLPAIVGAEGASQVLKDGDDVTVSCAEGETGFVYEGTAKFEVHELGIDDVPATRTEVMLNMANPAAALRWWQLPNDGVGLARIEFIINNEIKIHPMALVRPDGVKDAAARREIRRLTKGYEDPKQYFVDKLASGVAQIAASQYPRPAIVRMSDFKTNEYARLIGGEAFEPDEANPMLGWRGASRYYSDDYRDGFALECQAIKKVRNEMGLTNVVVMIPFCRTLGEADATLAVMAENGLERGKDGLETYVMCEIPSNVILADQFAERFDGFSIGSNDLTQLTLGIDRDSARLAGIFDEANDAVTALISDVIEKAHRRGRKVGLCGQAPSDRPEFAGFLVDAGIDSISVTPDSFIRVKQHVAEAESRRTKPSADAKITAH